MWNASGVPLKVLVLIGSLILVLSRTGSLHFWRAAEDALSSADEHAGLTQDEAVAKAVARVDGYLDRRARTTNRVRGQLATVRVERETTSVQWWCRSCDHWLVELVQRAGPGGAGEGERFCLAVTETFTAFSTGCARWMRPAAAPPEALLASAAAPSAERTNAGVLVFQRRLAKTADIYTLDVASGRVSRLTFTPEHEFSPTWSRNGTRIAFGRNLGGSELDLFMMNADGSDIERLTDSAGPDDQPTWLPDGRLAFRSVRDGHGSTYLLDPARPRLSPRRVLVSTSTAEWSPSGKVIAFSAPIDFGFDIWLTAGDGRRRWNLTSTLSEDAYRPRWSPDGTRIAFSTGDGIYVMRSDGRGRRRIVSEPHQFALAWSPDGRRIAWVGAGRSGGIRATSIDGRRTVRLTSNPLDDAPDWR